MPLQIRPCPWSTAVPRARALEVPRRKATTTHEVCRAEYAAALEESLCDLEGRVAEARMGKVPASTLLEQVLHLAQEWALLYSVAKNDARDNQDGCAHNRSASG